MVGDRGQDCSQGDKNVLNLKTAIQRERGGSATEAEARRNKWMCLEEWVRQGNELYADPERERCCCPCITVPGVALHAACSTFYLKVSCCNPTPGAIFTL